MFIIIFLFFSFPLFAQSAPTNEQVSVEVNFSNLQFGKPFSVAFTAPPPVKEILSVSSNYSNTDLTAVTITNIEGVGFRLEAVPYSTVPYDFPSLLVTALDDKSNTNLFYTPSFTVPISNEMADTTNFQLIDIVPPPFVWNHLWTIFIILFIFIIFLIIFLARLRKPQEKPVIVEDPFELIKKRLKVLKSRKDSLTEESYKEFFVELSEIVRDFLSHTTVPLALESPTSEILDLLKKCKASKQLIETARFLLRTCDAAKYAKTVFSQERTDEAISSAYDLLKFRPEEDKK